MSRPHSDTAELLHFWRNIEFVTPFSLDDLLESADIVQPVALIREEHPQTELSFGGQTTEWYGFPLVTHVRDPELEYVHDFFFGPFEQHAATNILISRFPALAKESPPDHRRVSGLSCIGRLTFLDSGEPLLGELKLSTFPWAVDRLLLHQPLRLSLFDDFSVDLIHQIQSLLSPSAIGGSKDSVGTTEEVTPAQPLGNTPHFVAGVVPYDSLLALSSLAVKDSQLCYFPGNTLGFLVSYPIRKKRPQREHEDGQPEEVEQNERALREILAKKRRVDILNSFCLDDLERARDGLKVDKDSALLRYLTGFSDEGLRARRIDLLKPAARRKALSLCAPEETPLGRWPAPSRQRASLTQQFALNYYFSESSPLVAVNGPPGTGKTTLIRDFIAAVVVARAEKLASFTRADDTVTVPRTTVQVGKSSFTLRPVHPSLTGFEIVVASNNNNAVENISKALPHHGALGEEFLSVAYLRDVAHRFFGSPRTPQGRAQSSDTLEAIWGLPSIALGNKKNRNAFRTTVLVPSPPMPRSDGVSGSTPVSEPGEDLLSWRKQRHPDAKSFSEARDAFKKALAEVKAILPEWQALWYSECDTTSSWLSPQIQSYTPGCKDKVQTLRAALFTAALDLHEAWVREVPELDRVIRLISRLLLNPYVVEERAATLAWSYLFMIFPVVSTTLASVERMFKHLPAQSLGHVVIDEAGQSSPQGAVGILTRAKRALVIGDQRQLEPICVVPDALIDHFTEMIPTSLESLCSSHALLSCQTLADGASEYGTCFGKEDPQWVGIPLIVHRRCLEPMFSISNEIAYDGVMLNLTPSITHDARFPESCWIHVPGEASNRHWVREQGEFALSLMVRFLAVHQDTTNFFVISPFREVRRGLQGLLSDWFNRAKRGQYPPHLRLAARRSIGTVHSFQGRESDIVILVLGCDEQSLGAAHWAGAKPNLLNVAVTRARHRLYVIGDAHLWHDKGYFSDLQRRLSVVTVEGFTEMGNTAGRGEVQGLCGFRG